MSKPREWLIDEEGCAFELPKALDLKSRDECIHVIEMNVYEAVVKERNVWHERVGINQTVAEQFREERDKLKADLEVAVKVLDRLVRGFDEDIPTTPRSHAADDCRKALAKIGGEK